MKISGLPMLLLFVALGGCAMEKGDFPSLAPRPIEKRGEDIATKPPTPAGQADAALLAKIAQLRAQIDAGNKSFSDMLPRVTQAVNAGRSAAGGSEKWVVAQQMLSGLESARAPTVTALAELDSLYLAQIGAIAAGKATGGAEELRAAQLDGSRLAQEQQAQLDELKARLSR